MRLDIYLRSFFISEMNRNEWTANDLTVSFRGGRWVCLRVVLENLDKKKFPPVALGNLKTFPLTSSQ